MASASFNLAPSRLVSGRNRSHDSLQSLDHRRQPDSANIQRQFLATQASAKSAKEEIKAANLAQEKIKAPVSRVELLLLNKKAKSPFTPQQDTPASQSVNNAIRLSDQWSGIQKAITSAPTLTAVNLAYALYRLGCFCTFNSRLRNSEMKASNVVPQIFGQAMAKLDEMEPSALVLLLDGCARLQHRPSENELSKIAASVYQNVYTMNASQLPLVLWAFMTLHYNPGPKVLLSLEDAVSRQASELSPQGVALVLDGFHAAQYQLSTVTLDRLADIVQHKALLFKPSEVAISLKALSAQGYKPSPAFVQAVADRCGVVSKRDLPAFSAPIPEGTQPKLAFLS